MIKVVNGYAYIELVEKGVFINPIEIVKMIKTQRQGNLFDKNDTRLGSIGYQFVCDGICIREAARSFRESFSTPRLRMRIYSLKNT